MDGQERRSEQRLIVLQQKLLDHLLALRHQAPELGMMGQRSLLGDREGRAQSATRETVTTRAALTGCSPAETIMTGMLQSTHCTQDAAVSGEREHARSCPVGPHDTDRVRRRHRSSLPSFKARECSEAGPYAL
eukprot:512237-Rhodomonas_salina.3